MRTVLDPDGKVVQRSVEWLEWNFRFIRSCGRLAAFVAWAVPDRPNRAFRRDLLSTILNGLQAEAGTIRLPADRAGGAPVPMDGGCLDAEATAFAGAPQRGGEGGIGPVPCGHSQA